jgi:Spy/CpxP family protein refolding chaperone
MGFGPEAWTGLNLSKEQMDKMWQLRERFRNETERLRYELFKKRLELKDLYADPTTDKATLLAKEKEVSGLRQALRDKMVQFKIERRAILTPEQLKQLKDTPYGHGFGMGFGAGFRGEDMGYGPCRW